MKITHFAAASAIALAASTTPALAQHSGHGGMTMPMQSEPTGKKKPVVKKTETKKAAQKKIAKKPVPAKPSAAVHEHSPQNDDFVRPQVPAGEAEIPADHSTMVHDSMTTAVSPPATESQPIDHSAMNHAAMTHDTSPMSGAFGSYPMTRDSSGTAWQPDASEHMGVHAMSGDWTLMGHGLLNLVYDHQSDRRGDDKAFLSGMLMGMARRPLGDGTLQFKAMVSPDPLMGKKGYPLLLASGETANGTDRLIDRQHPHDFFMELSASVSQDFGTKSSAFLYAALPGEPAFGPPAFMHREAILDSPEAPISHHWLDSTHISFGVLTGGLVLDRFKIEVSRFNGREPDEHRWNIETGELDSTAVRISANPTKSLALQASWGHFEDPEQLEPGVDQRRWSASALWADEISPGWKAAGTLAWGRKSIVDDEGRRHRDDALVAEASLKHGPWTIFARGETTENRELLALEEGEHGPAFSVGKISLGGIHDFKVADNVALGLGGLLAVNFVPDALEQEYGGSNPIGAMGFLRLKIE